MTNYQSLSHTKWECKYHVVFIPKYRKKRIFGEIRRELVEVFRRLAEQRKSRIEEGHLQADHVHMMISIPPKYSVAQVIGTSSDPGVHPSAGATTIELRPATFRWLKWPRKRPRPRPL